MKLMVFGYARHGKDTVAEILHQRFGMTGVSSSWFSTLRIMMPHFAAKGTPYETVEACYDDRVNHRAEWFDAIRAYGKGDLSKLSREIFAQYDVYTGCRSDREFNQTKCEGLFDYGVWVDASLRMPPEDVSSNKMQPWMADFVLDNNGTLEELEERTSALYQHLHSLAHTPKWL